MDPVECFLPTSLDTPHAYDSVNGVKAHLSGMSHTAYFQQPTSQHQGGQEGLMVVPGGGTMVEDLGSALTTGDHSPHKDLIQHYPWMKEKKGCRTKGPPEHFMGE